MNQPRGTSSSVGGPQGQPLRATRSTPLVPLLVVASVVLVSIVAGVLAISLQKGGALTVSDVGALAELAPVQAKLMPLDACKISYAARDKRGNRSHLESVFVDSCTGRDRFEAVVITVPRGPRGLGFVMERDAQSERFKVLVEKDEVPFPDLVTALSTYTPIVVEEFSRTLEVNRQRDQTYDADVRRKQKEAAERKAGAKQSYPTQ